MIRTLYLAIQIIGYTRMTRIETRLYRINDLRLIKVRLTFDFSGYYDKCCISFKEGNTKLEVISTTEGAIQHGSVCINTKRSEVQMEIEHIHNLESFDCLISYLQGDHLMTSEVLTTGIEKTASISSAPTKIATAKTRIGTYKERLRGLKSMLAKRSSSWRLHVNAQEDVIANVKTHGGTKIFVTFGDMHYEVRASDLIFTIEPKKQKILVPKEVYWKNYRGYLSEYLGFCELVKVDFHAADNVFYKCPISNSISSSDLPRKEDAHLENYRLPTGAYFDAKFWSIDEDSNLPVLMR